MSFWSLITMLIILGLGIPILQTIYNTFLNTTNGSWLNWTVSNITGSGNVTAYTEFEFNTFRFIPLLAGLMALAFILAMLGGAIQRRNEERRARGED